MANFITRIELHSAIDPHYETLHKQMAAKGFERHIESNNGVYELPHATYHIEKVATKAQILALAKSAVDATGRLGGIIVTEGLSTWSGLKKIK